MGETWHVWEGWRVVIMFKNQYDNDITVFSPQGRIHQIEYAMEAVKQGAAAVAAKSEKFAVVAGIMRAPHEMASHQPKVFKTDEHMGIAIAGLTADARYLTKFMRTECLNHRCVFGGPLQTQRLVQSIADKSQHHTQQYGKRPYGVGLLVIGYDQTGPHVFETDPSGNFFDYHKQAIGARSQAAKTYLEKKYESFPQASKDELIRHVIAALRETVGKKDEEKLSADNCAVGVVGEGQKFTILSVEEVGRHLEQLEQGGGGGEAMDVAE